MNDFSQQMCDYLGARSNFISRLLIVAGLSLCICVLVAAAFHFRLPLEDDAYISLRYARNLARGIGLVYNQGEFVEGYSNLLWVLILSGFYHLHLDAELMSSLLGIACSCLCVPIIFLGINKSSNPAPRLAGAFLFASNVYVWYWSGKGMETTLYMLLLSGGAISVARTLNTGSAGWKWSIFFGLAAVTRPEGILFGVFSFLIMALARWQKRTALKPLVIAGLVILIPPLLQFLFRIDYYGDVLPNTFYAKVSTGTQFYERGLRYIWDSLLMNPVLSLTLFVQLGLLHRSSTGVRYLLAFIMLAFLSIVYEGGDHFYGGRMLVPFIPLFCVLFQELAIQLFERLKHLGLATVTGVFISSCLVGFLVAAGMSWNHGPTNQKIAMSIPDMQLRRSVGEWLNQHSQPDDWIATPAAGLLPYAADRPTIDTLGLTDRQIGRRSVALGSGVAGHEKGDGKYVLLRKPRFFVPFYYLFRKPEDESTLRTLVWDRTSREMFSSEEFYQIYHLRMEPYENGYLAIFETTATKK